MLAIEGDGSAGVSGEEDIEEKELVEQQRARETAARGIEVICC